MKKILYTLIAILGFTNVSLAQCGTIMVNSTKLQYPDTNTNLPNAPQGFPYTTTIQFYAPTSINSVPIGSISIGTISGLPSGVNWGIGKYPLNINSGTSGCIVIQSSSIINSPIGVYPIIINATANSSAGSFPFQITGYKIQVKFTNVFTANQSSWYSQNEWLLNYDSITNGGGSIEANQYLIMKDSLAKKLINNSTGGFDTNYNELISFGSVIDVCDRVIDYAKNPFIKASKIDSAYLDSVSFPYIYIRNTDSITVGSNKRAVVDTMIVSWYTKNNLSKYYLNSTPIRLIVMPPPNSWDFSTLMQTNFFKRDTILLTKTDTTSVYSIAGISETGWTDRKKYLKAPAGMFENAIDAQKLFGFTVNFKSGVSVIDTGIMIYQGNSTSLPINLKRPNYFGTTGLIDNNAFLGNLTDSSYSDGLLATKFSSYLNTSGFKGYIPSKVFISQLLTNSSFKVRSKMVMQCAVSDSIICKGKTVTFNLSNCNLFNGTTNLGTGIINQTPLQTKAYQIKSNGVTIATITISVIDSLNIQRITSSDTLSFCGYNSKFLIGVNTTNSSPKNYLWYKNDTLLAGKTLAIDTFTTAGKYKVTITTSTGCYQEQSFFINKLNSTFNPDFSVNKQIDSIPPFDFIFSNNTTPLADYNFTWKWGNGDSTVSNNVIQFYTYSANGQYNVKLTAQNKITGCKDSIIKNSFITCSGNAPLSLSTLKTNPICNNGNTGAISVTASGGFTPYQYKLNAGSYQTSNSFTNLGAGIYTVSVKDANNTIVSKVDTLINPIGNSIGTIAGLSAVATNSTQAYSISTQSGATYAWNIINGTLLSGNGTNSIQVQWAGLAGVGKVMISMTKNACTVTDSLNIVIGNPPLSMATIVVNPPCSGTNNGSITVNAYGGTSPYQYKLNTGSYQSNISFSNLGAGIYTVYVKDALNNTVSKTDTINFQTSLNNPSISGSNGVPVSSTQNYNIASQNGVIYKWNIINGTLLSGNGTNSIQVQWAAVAGMGKVIANIAKNSCSAADTLVVSIGSNPLTSSTTKTDETCAGKANGVITTNATGGTTPYLYSINNGTYQSGNTFNNLVAGIYVSKVKDASNVISQNTDNIIAGPGITAGAMNGPTTVALSALSTYLIAQQTGATIAWTATNGIVIGGQGTNIGQVSWGATAGAGMVKVKVTSAAGCVDSTMLNVTIGSTNITNIGQSLSFTVYPNPAKDELIISTNLKLNGAHIIITDMLGRKMLEETITNASKDHTVLVNELKTGAYILSIQKEGEISRIKFVKE